jgi:hypothetical protein
LLETLGGKIRWTETSIALARSQGRVAERAAHLTEGRARLLARAERIRDEGLRRSFLSVVPDRGRLLRLGEGGPPA